MHGVRAAIRIALAFPPIAPLAAVATIAMIASTGAPRAQAPAPELARFYNQSLTFHIDLPAGWRQLAPNEARRLGENPNAPRELAFVQPRQFYAIGPVDRWLQGDFAGAWLWVVEQGNEWVLADDYAAELAAMWERNGSSQGVRYEIRDVRRTTAGAAAHRVVRAERTGVPAGGGRPTRYTDVYAPAGGQQITLSFACPAEDYARWQPEFERWLATLAFARAARGEQTLSDRLWTPLITGAAVGLILLLLYKHTRRAG
jgi:hypothetical protein